jgi:cobalamin biosynthesis Mg chelatase CobN
MNKFYILVPVILLGLFSVVYWQHSKESAQKAVEKKMAEDKKHDEEIAKKKIAEEKAKEDADKRSKAREKEESDKEIAKQAKYQADIDTIKKDTAKYAGEAENYSKQAAGLDTDLANLRASKEKLIRESFELDKKVELAKIDRRNAELEIQRMTEMIAKRAADSAMAKMPPVVATTSPGK